MNVCVRKKVFLSLFFLMTVGNIFGQYTDDIPKNRPFFDLKKISWGYYFGMNFYDFKIDYKTDKQHIIQESHPGFQVGLVGNLNLNPSFSIRTTPGVYFTNRKLIFKNLTSLKDSVRDISSNFVQIPIYLKFNTIRYGNIRPYIIGGVTYAYNINAFETSKNDNSTGRFRLKSQNVFYEVGFGFEMYLYYFKFTPSVVGVFSMFNELVPDRDSNSPWTSNIESMKTRGIYINLTFE